MPDRENCGADGWALTPSWMRGALNNALSIYFADATLATGRFNAAAVNHRLRSLFACGEGDFPVARAGKKRDPGLETTGAPANVGLGGNVDARHHCYLCRLGSSIDHFGASRPRATKQSHCNRTHCLPY